MTNRILIAVIIVTVTAWIAFCANLIYTNMARGQDVPRWDAESRLELGRCLRAEADTHRADWAPIAFVLLRRYKIQQQDWTVAQTIRRYCAVFDRRSPRYYSKRAQLIRSSTFEFPHHGSFDEWRELEAFVDSFVNGEVRDPCPEAVHFGGRIDRKLPGHAEIDCGDTVNTFYRRAP